MSCASDQDMSDCSNSPTYTTLETPQSSPLQQVPQLTTKLTSLCTDKNLYNSTKNGKGSEPFLRIIEQPQKYFRFRYNTEKAGSSHGGILGKTSVENKSKNKTKTHPTVELVNFEGEAVIRCSIKYDDDHKKIHKNIYKILEDAQTVKSCKGQANGILKVGFPGIGIVTYTRSDLTDLLYKKLLEVARKNSANTSELRTQCGNWAKDIDQNVVRLKFTAHDMASGKEICSPVLSEPIFNKKSPATNALKIFRMSASSGRASGREDLFLLVDKIDKNETKVRFYEVGQNGERLWSEWAHFGPSDVHFQYAIVCSTPPYRNPKTSVNVDVFIELVRTSNGTTSDPLPFRYQADPVCKYGNKRPRIATPTCRSESFSSESLNLEQAPVIILQNDQNGFISESVAPQLTPTTSENWVSIPNSSEDILEALEPQVQSPMWGPCYTISYVGNPAQTVTHYPAEVSFTGTNTESCPVESSFTALHTLPNEAELGTTSSSTGVGSSELVFTADLTQSCSMEHIDTAPTNSDQAELCTAALPTPSFSNDPSSNDVVIEEDLLQDIESDLMEAYADVFGLTFTNEDYFSLNKTNRLVGDSGRVKEVSTSATQTGDTVGTEHAICDNDAHFQGAMEEILSTGAVEAQGPHVSQIAAGEVVREEAETNYEEQPIDKDEQENYKVVLDKIRENRITIKCYEVVEPQMDLLPHTINTSEVLRASMQNRSRLLLSMKTSEENWLSNSEEAKSMNFSLASVISLNTRAIDHEGARERTKVSSARKTNEAGVAGYSRNKDKGTSTDAEATGSVNRTDFHYPSFSAKDAIEVKKLVRDLCQIIRDKKISKNEMAIKLDRLFDIRLSNGDTFLHMTLLKSQRSCETLIKMINCVKMTHLFNYGNYRGETILHLAVVQGTPELVSLLVTKGCDPMARNCEDETAIHYAVRYASSATLKALLDAAQRIGAKLDLDAATTKRQSALHLCVVEDRARCASLLCAAGAGCGARDAAGRTPLHLCAYDARVDVARALLPYALPHLDALDAAGRTPLAVACECAPTSFTLQLVQVLVAAGARADLAWTAARKHPALVELLRPHMPPDMPLDDFKSETDTDTDTDEYESADDEFIDDSRPEFLSRKVGQMALIDNEEQTDAIK